MLFKTIARIDYKINVKCIKWMQKVFVAAEIESDPFIIAYMLGGINGIEARKRAIEQMSLFTPMKNVKIFTTELNEAIKKSYNMEK